MKTLRISNFLVAPVVATLIMTDATAQTTPETPKDVGAVPENAERTASGLAFKILTKGTGTEKPGPTDKVSVHYSGWTTDGKMFDSSVKRGKPTSFGVNQVIKGWTEGLQLMVEGEKRRFWIPANLAYGDNPAGGRPAGMLVFDVELLDILKPPKTPGDVASVPENAVKTESGLASRVLQKGTGKKNPKDVDTVTVHYSGWTTDGKMFDSSVTRGQPTSFPLNGVIKGWTEGVQLMVEGEKRRFWIPADLAYGDNPGGGRPGGMLVFDIELIGIKEAPKPPEVPKNVAAPPEGADKTKSGLASKVIEKGTGKTKPTTQSVVRVHYTGWTTDGKMFDSSVTRGQPATFPLNRVIKGWTEGVQLMVEGEKRRFWIPAELGYGANPPQGAPAGMLVFDVELLKIVQ